MKAFGKGTSAACVEDCDDSDGDPFVPNDFAEDDPFQDSEVIFLIWFFIHFIFFYFLFGSLFVSVF